MLREALCHGMAMGWAVMDGVEDAMEAQKKQVLNCRMPVRAQASLRESKSAPPGVAQTGNVGSLVLSMKV